MEGSTKFTAVVTDGGKAALVEQEKRPLQEGEVLIRVEASPVNPSDRYMAAGAYGIKKLMSEGPQGLGFDGSGVVIEAHESVDSSLVGKTVSFFEDPHIKGYQGSWRQFLYKKSTDILVFDEGVKPIDCFGTFVNPMTVLAIIDFTKKNGHKALVHAAAASNLGKMLVKVAKNEGIPLINIVRRTEQVEALENIGAEHVLNSTSDTFEEDLEKLAETLNVTAFFDPIGADFTAKVLDRLPNGSTAYIYGGLGGAPISIGGTSFIFFNKKVQGLWLGPWLDSLTTAEREAVYQQVIDDLSKGGEIFGSNVLETYPITKFEEAINAAEGVASDGKLIINPQLS